METNFTLMKDSAGKEISSLVYKQVHESLVGRLADNPNRNRAAYDLPIVSIKANSEKGKNKF